MMASTLARGSSAPQGILFRIDERGAVTDTRLTNRSGASAAVLKELSESVARMQFIPGFFGGKPVPMHYAEPVGSGN